MKQAISRSEYFVYTVQAADGKAAMFKKQRKTRGREALEIMYCDFFAPGSKTEESAKWLSAYGWLLDVDKQNRLEVTMKHFIREQRALLASSKCLTNGGVDGKADGGDVCIVVIHFGGWGACACHHCAALQ